MTSPDPPSIDRLVVNVLVANWRDLLLRGHMTPNGVLALRSRLDPTSGEFAQPNPNLDLLRLQVEDVLATILDMDPNDLPGRPSLDRIPPEWLDDPPAA